MNIKKMKVFVQIIDKNNASYQTCMVEEPIQKGFEIANAIGHFGVNINNVEWLSNNDEYKFGKIKETTKVITVVCL